jgi:hypothetical protein
MSRGSVRSNAPAVAGGLPASSERNPQSVNAEIAAPAINSPTAAAARGHQRRGPAAACGTVAGGSSNASTRSDTSRQRAAESLRRQRSIVRRNAGGVVAGSRVQSGSLRSTDAITSALESPENVRRPVSASYSTHPSAQMSAR